MKSYLLLISTCCLALCLAATSVLADKDVESDFFSSRDEQRQAPPRLPINEPQQLTFESDSVGHATISRDGRFLVHTARKQGFNELWLRTLDVSKITLPKLLGRNLSEYRSPAISNDGRWVAYVSTGYDVKGDIYLLDLSKPDVKPRRLTGRETEDSAPSFGPDSSTLYFHHFQAGSTKGQVLIVDLSKKEPTPRLLPIAIDATFPVISPDNRKCAFVSRRDDPNGDILIADLSSWEIQPLTSGTPRDMYPSWSADGRSIYFNRFSLDTNKDAIVNTADNAVVYQAFFNQEGLIHQIPLTSANYSALQPNVATDGFIFLSLRQGGAANVFKLPLAGEIPIQSTADGQITLAAELDKLIPADPYLALLGHYSVLAHFGEEQTLAAPSALAIGRLYKDMGFNEQAISIYQATSQQYREAMPHAILAEIASQLLITKKQYATCENKTECQQVLLTGLAALEKLGSNHPNDPEVEARVFIDQANLLNELSQDGPSKLKAIKLLEQVATMPGVSSATLAEARFNRAGIMAATGEFADVTPLYLEIVENYPKQEKWADQAVEQILSQTVGQDLAVVGPETRQQLQQLASSKGQNLPRLAMAAWNRIGDIHYAKGEWQQAKAAYQRVLTDFKQINSRTGAARLALAEILYREERFHQALDLYETEMAGRPHEDRFYRLALQAFLRSSLAAGERLYRLGEVNGAADIFLGLIRRDYSLVAAHRGYIKCAAARKSISPLLKLYQNRSKSNSHDPVSLYGAGLSLTYLDEGSPQGRKNLAEAQKLVEQAIGEQGDISFFHQTLGYIHEVKETVYGEQGQLEKGLTEYQKGYFLGLGHTSEQNRADLQLNIGNMYYLLDQFGNGFEFYQQRLASKAPFGVAESEILFYRRLGAAAFQLGRSQEPITAYEKALELIEERMDPAGPSELFGKINERVGQIIKTETARGVDSAAGPAAWESLAEEQAAINRELFRLTNQSFGPPPDPAWNSYRDQISNLLATQLDLLSKLYPRITANRAAQRADLQFLVSRVRQALDAPHRLLEMRVELLDRLGLAHQENKQYLAAEQAFAKTLALNEKLGLTQNLARNQRSMAYCLYMAAGEQGSKGRRALLQQAAAGFRHTLELLEQYGTTPLKKEKKQSSGLLGLSLEAAVDEKTGTQAAYGFSLEQEMRLAQTFLARIETELGHLASGRAMLAEPLKSYPPELELKPTNLHGVGLLYHRAAHLDHGLRKYGAAFKEFERSAQLSLKQENPMSALLNVANMAACLTEEQGGSPATTEFSAKFTRLLQLDRAIRRLIRAKQQPGSRNLLAEQYNNLAVYYLALAERFASTPDTQIDQSLFAIQAEQQAATHLAAGLALFNENPPSERAGFAQLCALHLNSVEAASLTSDPQQLQTHLEAALKAAEQGVLSRYKWRVLAELGRFDQALESLSNLTILESGCGAGEISHAFAPLINKYLAQGKNEAAFNLLERLSEYERVGRLAPLLLGRLGEQEKELLGRITPRLQTIEELKNQLAGAGEEQRKYLQTRLKSEEDLLAATLGDERQNLPEFALLAESETTQNMLLLIAGLAVQVEEASEQAVQAGSDTKRNETRKQLAHLLQKYSKSLDQARLSWPSGELNVLAIFQPRLVELMDVMDNLEPEQALIRLYPQGTGPESKTKNLWTAFIVTMDELQIKTFVPAVGPSSWPNLELTFVSENPPPFTLPGPVALNSAHFLRVKAAAKPFKNTILAIPELSSRAAIPPDFTNLSIGADSSIAGLLAALANVNTLILNDSVHSSQTIPTRPGERPTPMLGLQYQGALLSAGHLAGKLSNVSLVLATDVPTADGYLLGHFFSLLGVPTMLIGQGGEEPDAHINRLLDSYASLSVFDALDESGASDETIAGWRLLGFPGLSPAQMETLGRTRFGAYVKEGVNAYKQGRYETALLAFENGLQVAERTPTLAGYLPNLYKYSRESAYLLGRLDRAVYFGENLLRVTEATAPDSEAHAEVLNKLGLLQAAREQYDQAAPLLEEALDITAGLELGAQQIGVLADLGLVLENDVQYHRALERYRAAAVLSDKMLADELLARQYTNIGRVYDLRLSLYAEAKKNYAESLAIYRDIGESASMAQALLDMGRCNRLLGNFPGAEELYEQALALVKDDPAEIRLWANVRMEQANNAWFQGSYQDAFNLTGEVATLAEKHGWLLERVQAKNTIGLIWWTLGDHERALRELEEGLELARTLNARRDEVATTLNNQGLVLREMGRFQPALETLHQALTIDRQLGSRWAIAYDLRNIALTHLMMGAPDKALPLLQEALPITEEIGNKINQAKVRLALGATYEALGQYPEARQAYEAALQLAKDMVLRETQWRALHGLARLLLKEERNIEARTMLEQALIVIETMRADIKVNQLKEGFLGNKMAVYEDLVSLLVGEGEVEEAFRVAERSRARNLIDLLGNQRLNLSGSVDQELYEQQKQLRAGIEEHEQLSAHAANEQERQVYDQALQKLRDQYRDLMLEIQAKNPELAGMITVDPLAPADIRALLDPDTALLTYYLTKDELYCWLVSREDIQLFRIPVDRQAMGQTILEYRRGLQNLEPVRKTATDLYSLLIGPLKPKLQPFKRLGIVPHGPLHYLSFATLEDETGYLIEQYPLFYLPSAAVYGYTIKRRGTEKNVRVLAIGNPDLNNPGLELPFAQHEVATIGYNFPDITMLSGNKATESWVTNHIKDYGIIHLASHGEFNPINPLFSAVRLTKDQQADGKLEATEVFGLEINADLVVLSACQSGLGKVTGGDDVIGFNRAFLYAGTHAVISSMWRVSDISTAVLMKHFYRNYATNNKADSLRSAMLHVRNRFPHPGYWGAFLLVGDWE
ncbi:MAG: CHAT domain-containing protein [Desulfobulbaceae bacterium]|nr:CHAT domain-containing protein [Desulfobulbaceae bacterium]